MRITSAFLGLLIGLCSCTAAIAGGPAGVLQFSQPVYSIGEAGGQATITVNRTGGTTGAIAVSYATTDGSAGSDDYTSAAGTLNWADGVATAQTFDVTITDDARDEPDTQTVVLTLSAPTNGASIGSPNPATLNIGDNDVEVIVPGIGTVAATPAATLLLPHFQVDPTDPTGIGTVMTLGNTSGFAQLAHVTLWTDRGVPTRTFDVRLPYPGATEVDLRALFTSGTMPTGTVTTGNCFAPNPAPVTLSAADITALRNAHTGQASTLLGGQCGGADYGDGIARGYVTIDAVGNCSTTFPGDGTYFGTTAINENVLWGEYSVHTPSANLAYGDTLVHIEASLTDSDTDGVSREINFGSQSTDVPDYTFYGRRIGASAADRREGLPSVWMGQFSLADVIPRTTAIVWRDPGRVAPFACNSAPAAIPTLEVVAFDQREDVSGDQQSVSLPLASQAIRLDDPGQTAIPYEKGMLHYSLSRGDNEPLFGGRNQAHVSHVYESSFGGAGVNPAWPLHPINGFAAQAMLNPPGPFTAQCSDGNDNDGDGNVDFPADSDCTSAFDDIEAPGRCSDGVDNDFDGFIDFPDDIGCRTPEQLFENNPSCSDEFDNDGDGDIDFPADSDCASALQTTENPACSDGVDNDGDLQIDHPADVQCLSPFDTTEGAISQCQDGIDNDGDGQTDYPGDLQCDSESEDLEAVSFCSDGVDNDGDGLTDFPLDLGCETALDDDETNGQCIDGIDNDGDLLIDFPADLGCTNANDFSEVNPVCIDGIDNDSDGFTDFPADVGCSSATDTDETNAQCNDGLDNDSDGFTDFPADVGCGSLTDNSETNPPMCSDSLDNDGDGLTDFPFESGCSSPSDAFEGPDCSTSETADNDLDGLADFGSDPGCASATDQNELAGTITRSCSDGIDNDGNGAIDFPADAGCESAWDDVEFTAGIKAPTLDILPNTLPNGIVAEPYLQLITAVNGVAPYTFAVTSGTLPPGLMLAADGTLSGTPTQAGLFNFIVTATDQFGATATQAYSLRIATQFPVVPVPEVIPVGSPWGLLLLCVLLALGAGRALRRD
jgi:hypothetical protein